MAHGWKSGKVFYWRALQEGSWEFILQDFEKTILISVRFLRRPNTYDFQLLLLLQKKKVHKTRSLVVTQRAGERVWQEFRFSPIEVPRLLLLFRRVNIPIWKLLANEEKERMDGWWVGVISTCLTHLGFQWGNYLSTQITFIFHTCCHSELMYGIARKMHKTFYTFSHNWVSTHLPTS